MEEHTTNSQYFRHAVAPRYSGLLFILENLLSIRIGQYGDAGDAEAELLPIAITRYATGGSGGSVRTPRPHVFGSGASAVVVDSNNTTQGTTPTVILQDSFNLQAGWLYVPTPEEWITIPPSGSWFGQD